MPKQKPVEPVSSDDEADQVDHTAPVIAVIPDLDKKKKKERTPAQKEAFSKALSILKEKREAKKKEDEEKYVKASAVEKELIEKEKYEKAKNHKKKLPPAPSYVTTGDLEKFKLDLLNALPKNKPEPEPVKVEPVKKPEVIVKKEPVVQKTLTGHELLDKLFFS
jgi:hypothetical protein